MNILDFFGGDTSAEDAAALEAIRKQGQLYENLPLPVFEQLTPEMVEYAGDVQNVAVSPWFAEAPDLIQMERVDPRLASVALQERSNMFNISTDPRLRAAQLDALGALGGIAERGGLTLTDEANLARLQSQVAQADRGRREAILQNMQMRGQGGSGLELLAQMQSAQDATTGAADASRDIAAAAQDRALQAILQQGALGGQIRGQEFGEQADIAKAQDIINAFNAGNLTQGNQFNAAAINRGQEFNVGNVLQTQGQNIANTQQNRQFNAAQGQTAETGTANRAVEVQTGNVNRMQDVLGTRAEAANAAQQFNRFNIPQQTFENRLARTGGQSGAAQNFAAFQGQRADRKQAAAAETLGALIKGGTAILAPKPGAQ